MSDQDPTQPFEPTTAPAQPVPKPSAPGEPPVPPAGSRPLEPDRSQRAPAAPGWSQPTQTGGWTPPTGPGDAAPVPPASVQSTGLDVPVAPIGGRRHGRNPLRWAVALLVVALVVAGGLGATLLLTSSTSATSVVLGYAPADTTLYAEGRLDLPGSQRAEVAKALAAFPGFADQASLNTKLGEVLDRILRAATQNKHDYQTEIAPWFSGQIAVAQGPQGGFGGLVGVPGMPAAPSPTISPAASLPACTGGDAATAAPSPSGVTGSAGMSVSVRALVLAGITDSTKAADWVGTILGQTNVKTSDRTCDGVVVHVMQALAESYVATPEFGWAVLGDKVLVAGDIDSIRLAIATKGTSGLSGLPGFQKAVAALPGDHVGFFYEPVRAPLSAQIDTLKAFDTEGTISAVYRVLAPLLPEWVAGDLKAADGNFVVDTVSPASDLKPSTNRASDLAALAPASSIALVDIRDLGKTLGSLKDKVAAEPKLQTYVKQLDDALGLAGGFAGTVGWIGDAGFAVTSDGSTVSGGVIIRPDDAAAATRLFTELRSLVALGGASSGLSLQDEAYKGATITSLDLSALAPALQSQLKTASPGMTVPSNLKFVYTVTDKAVVLTLDASFAKAVIDAAQGGDSLAKNARFEALLSKAGDKGTGLVWLDVAATRDLAEGRLPTSDRARYDADIRPYFLPLDAFLGVGSVDSGLQRGSLILSVKH